MHKHFAQISVRKRVEIWVADDRRHMQHFARQRKTIFQRSAPFFCSPTFAQGIELADQYGGQVVERRDQRIRLIQLTCERQTVA